MPPLVIVSNGQTTYFYTTYDGETWDPPKNLSGEVFAELISRAAETAAQDRDEAIKNLLGSNPRLWSAFLRAHTFDTLVNRTGALGDFTTPFAHDFSVERAIVPQVLSKLRRKETAITVVGPPLSGKSVVLKQCCEKLKTGNLVPLYIDASSTQHGPLRLLASIFARNLFTATNVDQVRQWLVISLRSMQGDSRLVLFLDELLPTFNDVWLGDLDELLDLATTSSLSIVLALDPNSWKALEMRPGRSTKTKLGQRAKLVSLDLLSNQEFEAAMDKLIEVTRSQPYSGGEYNIEYREAPGPAQHRCPHAASPAGR